MHIVYVQYVYAQTPVHRYSVWTCMHACMWCCIVVTVLGERVPGPGLWAPCTKDLSVLPGGIWLSVWAAPQSAGPCAQPPALSTRTHTHTYMEREYTWQSRMHFSSLASTGLWHTHKQAHTHTRTPPTPWESWSVVKLDHWHSYGFLPTK